MKVSVLIKRLEELRYEHFQLQKMSCPSGLVPEEAEVLIEFWDKHGFHGLISNFYLDININNTIEISPYD